MGTSEEEASSRHPSEISEKRWGVSFDNLTAPQANGIYLQVSHRDGP